MAGLKKLLAAVGRALRIVWEMLAALFSALFGSIEWYAPDWLHFTGRRLRAAGQALVGGARAHPARSAGARFVRCRRTDVPAYQGLSRDGDVRFSRTSRRGLSSSASCCHCSAG